MSAPPALPEVVLDTDVLVRALIKPAGVSAEVLDALTDGHFTLVTSEVLLRELDATLRKPRIMRYAALVDEDIERLVQVVRRLARVVAGDLTVEIVRADPKDDPVVAAALEAGARTIVSGDRRHLLALKVVVVAGYAPVQIVSVPAFLRHVLGRPRPTRPS